MDILWINTYLIFEIAIFHWQTLMCDTHAIEIKFLWSQSDLGSNTLKCI